MREEDEDVALHIATLSGPVVVLMVPSNIIVSEIRRMLQHNAETCYMTQYDLVTSKGVVVSDVQQLNGQDGCSIKDCNLLKMVFTQYSQRGIREHLIQMRALHTLPLSEMSVTYGNDDVRVRSLDRKYPIFRKLTGLSAELSLTTGMRSEHQEATKAFTSSLISGPNSLIRGLDVQSITSAADSHSTPLQPTIANHISDPPAGAKLRGDLFYFTVSFEKDCWGIAAHRTGFYKLESCELRPPAIRPSHNDVFQTLLGLLCDIVPDQRERYEQLICLRVSHVCYEDHPLFPATQWIGTSCSKQVTHDSWRTREHEIKISQPHDPRIPVRNWMAHCGIPELSPDQVVPDFLHTAIEAVYGVIDGSLFGINPGDDFIDQVFYLNGIAMSFCKEASERKPNSQTPAWHQAHKDLAISKVITTAIRTGKSDINITPPPTCCIDFMGYRIWCMSYSSDMYNRHAITQLASRSAVAADAPILGSAPEFEPALRRLCDVISLGKPDNLSSVSDSLDGVRLYKSRDGRVFFENASSLLAHENGDDPLMYRPELLCHSEGIEKDHLSDGLSSCGTNELDSSQDGNSRSSSYVSMNQSQHHISSVLEHQLSQAITDLESISFGDGDHVTHFLHERGLPMRCLVSLLRGLPRNSSNRRIIIFEALIRSVVRSLRVVMRTNRLQLSIPMLHFFNAIFTNSESAEVKSVLERCASHFSISEIPEWQSNCTDCWYILRGVCMRVGIQIAARDYAFGKNESKPLFRKSDFLNVVPVPYKCTSVVPARTVVEALQRPVDTGEELVQTGELSIQMLQRNDRTGCDKTMRVLLSEVCKAHGCDSPKIIPILFSLASNSTAFLDFSRAASLYCRAASVARITSGPSSPDYKSAIINFSLSLAKIKSPASLAISHLTLSSHLVKNSDCSLDKQTEALLDAVTKIKPSSSPGQ